MNEGGPVMRIDPGEWLQVFRDITNSTNQRTLVVDNIGKVGTGHTVPIIDYEHVREVASALVLANMNSLPLDWTARLFVGGTHMSFFIVKQLPILPPEAYLERVCSESPTYVEMIVPRVLELTYSANDLAGFARDIGYHGPPWPWHDERRHLLRCELDAIYTHMYGLERDEIEWILDAPSPSFSFPGLKRSELKQFGEYRTQRLVLNAFDQLARGELPNLENKMP